MRIWGLAISRVASDELGIRVVIQYEIRFACRCSRHCLIVSWIARSLVFSPLPLTVLNIRLDILAHSSFRRRRAARVQNELNLVCCGRNIFRLLYSLPYILSTKTISKNLICTENCRVFLLANMQQWYYMWIFIRFAISERNATVYYHMLICLLYYSVDDKIFGNNNP